MYSKEQTLKNNKSRLYFLVKRLMDIVLSILGLVLLSPVMIIVSIIIKFESEGPIIFVQERVGQYGELFKMYKFRSMIDNAEDLIESLKDKNEMSGPMFKITDDPRVTKIGKFIRKTSIDELPQLINVLKGEMSLVGPRPNLPREVRKFTPYQNNKLLAKPGLTCYWQVMGRNNIDFEEWIELDIKYIEDRSLWVDIKLIFKTIFLLFGDKNAR
ncbi:exopolysaccharide biosynthesis polyprenyl glycosylphosphotransferase [Clostridium sp. SYSU_GA19001]|uniref:sugar transferase n=1 Tax=Clostridium caldaquaticum TaxID=2940653 RepID=UPI00207744B0|nr:exopolysaccharide biosynthesis polyprenyl glycosylphosphotransferase [Clostridium caldaquaticum]MCM8709417.1 exopolysaccharide biosynthesis polyprenyl glycosylphosphotransferase [Clostridium caldaquaticum]